MKSFLQICGVEAYAEGKFGKPADATITQNWEYNDNYTQVVIIINISSNEMIHMMNCNTAKESMAQFSGRTQI